MQIFLVSYFAKKIDILGSLLSNSQEEIVTTALIVVDVQNDFCEGGALAVQGGNAVAVDIASYVGKDLTLAHARGYQYVLATRDAHIDPGEHFSADPDFIDSWPKHCVVGTSGQQFHPAIAQLPFDAIFDKGAYAAAYSGFEGEAGDGLTLHQWLQNHGVLCVDIVGLASDYCVRATALDAARNGYFTTVRLDMCAAVSPEQLPTVIEEFLANEVLVVN